MQFRDVGFQAGLGLWGLGFRALGYWTGLVRTGSELSAKDQISRVRRLEVEKRLQRSYNAGASAFQVIKKD